MKFVMARAWLGNSFLQFCSNLIWLDHHGNTVEFNPLSPSSYYLFKHLSDEKKETITKDKMSWYLDKFFLQVP